MKHAKEFLRSKKRQRLDVTDIIYLGTLKDLR
jgi:hypothetical protein